MVKQQPFKEALVSFMVICQLSFALLVGDLFVQLLEVLYPQIHALLPSAAETLRSYVEEMFTARKEVLKTALANSPSLIHFSFDLWSSPNHLALLGVVAHYIDEDGVNQSVSNVHICSLILELQISSFDTCKFLICQLSVYLDF